MLFDMEGKKSLEVYQEISIYLNFVPSKLWNS